MAFGNQAATGWGIPMEGKIQVYTYPDCRCSDVRAFRQPGKTADAKKKNVLQNEKEKGWTGPGCPPGQATFDFTP